MFNTQHTALNPQDYLETFSTDDVQLSTFNLNPCKEDAFLCPQE